MHSTSLNLIINCQSGFFPSYFAHYRHLAQSTVAIATSRHTILRWPKQRRPGRPRTQSAVLKDQPIPAVSCRPQLLEWTNENYCKGMCFSKSSFSMDIRYFARILFKCVALEFQVHNFVFDIKFYWYYTSKIICKIHTILFPLNLYNSFSIKLLKMPILI